MSTGSGAGRARSKSQAGTEPLLRQYVQYVETGKQHARHDELARPEQLQAWMREHGLVVEQLNGISAALPLSVAISGDDAAGQSPVVLVDTLR